MSDEVSIHVNFTRAMPLFPLDAAELLPQQILPLHIFEKRYLQMVSRALDGAGQIAMGVFRGDRWKQEYHARPPVRPAVCIGQIVQHEQVGEDRYNILLQGICRARILEEIEPEDDQLFRQVMLRPIGVGEVDEDELDDLRDWLDDALSESPLAQMTKAEKILDYVRNESIPTSALLELVSFTMTPSGELRYRLLAEGDASRRAHLLRGELEHIQSLIRRAKAQRPEEWPKGCSWN